MIDSFPDDCSYIESGSLIIIDRVEQKTENMEQTFCDFHKDVAYVLHANNEIGYASIDNAVGKIDLRLQSRHKGSEGAFFLAVAIMKIWVEKQYRRKGVAKHFINTITALIPPGRQIVVESVYNIHLQAWLAKNNWTIIEGTDPPTFYMPINERAQRVTKENSLAKHKRN